MKHGFHELVHWLYKEQDFPSGCVLLTGTGIVPPDGFSLAAGDEIRITISGIGELINLAGMIG
ncbi:MAG TPA: fumarylacetoacetate hydrolase family protein [Tepidisphaeraceae bacterium]|jgi:2-dehydro-3-deoxy-D-arabinonate dehydratase